MSRVPLSEEHPSSAAVRPRSQRECRAGSEKVAEPLTRGLPAWNQGFQRKRPCSSVRDPGSRPPSSCSRRQPPSVSGCPRDQWGMQGRLRRSFRASQGEPLPEGHDLPAGAAPQYCGKEERRAGPLEVQDRAPCERTPTCENEEAAEWSGPPNMRKRAGPVPRLDRPGNPQVKTSSFWR